MQDAAGHGSEEEPGAAPGPTSGRTWVHPSEVGFEHRTRSDRRRAAWMTAGLVVGGIGLLVVGVAMGLGSDRDPVAASSSPRDTVAATLASVTVDGQGPVTGVVVDDDGLVAVRAGALGGARTVYVGCGGREPHEATVIGVDEEADIAVIEASVGSGRPVQEDRSVAAGDEVLLARAGMGEAAPTFRRALVSGGPGPTLPNRSGTLLKVVPSERPATTTTFASTTSMIVASAEPPDPDADSAAFDADGNFVGLVLHGDDRAAYVLPAQDVIDVALALKR